MTGRGPPAASLHVRIDQDLGILAILLQERGEILARARSLFEEILVGEGGELRSAEDRQEFIVQALDDGCGWAAGNHRAPVDRPARERAEAGFVEGGNIGKLWRALRGAQR